MGSFLFPGRATVLHPPAAALSDSANASVVSSIRFEKPHSLSYQEQTFTSLPSITFVSVES